MKGLEAWWKSDEGVLDQVQETEAYFGLKREGESRFTRPGKNRSWLYWKIYSFRLWLSSRIAP